MSETMAATHINPPDRPRKQCLGIPIFDVDARVVDPATSPNCRRARWRDHRPRPAAPGPLGQADTAQASVTGISFLRTGDLARTGRRMAILQDRLKRMINARGYKVWPAEVEALMRAPTRRSRRSR